MCVLGGGGGGLVGKTLLRYIHISAVTWQVLTRLTFKVVISGKYKNLNKITKI